MTKTALNIVADATLNTNLFSLAVELPYSLEELSSVPALAAGMTENSDADDDKGYGRTYFHFRDSKAKSNNPGLRGFYIYWRWNTARIGCRNGHNNPNVKEFREFIDRALKGDNS